MGTRAHIIFEDADGKFHWRFHHWDGYIVGGVGSSLLENFANEDDAKFLIDINKDFSTINNGLSDKYAKGKADEGYYVVEYGSKLVVTAEDDVSSHFSMDLKEALRNCREKYIYLFSQKEKKWFVQWDEKTFFDLKLIVEVEEAFKEFTSDVKSEYVSGVGMKHERKTSLFGGDKDCANLFNVMKRVFLDKKCSTIIAHLVYQYDDKLDIENIINEVKIIIAHDSFEGLIPEVTKKIRSKIKSKV